MKPNIILVNCDDLGYGDLGCYGSPENRTPHLDQLAEEGIRFTDFYAMCPVCSASRAGMLTGTYPPRISFVDVLFPGAAKGMKPGENTIASLLKQQDYSTMIVGKWHCGDQKEFLPTEHGFDHYFGIPYSNDMGRQDRGDAARFWSQRYPDGIPPLPLLKDDEVIQEQPDQSAITERYVEKGVSFIRDNRDKPFFLYFPQMYVHLPIYVPENYLRNAGGDAYRAAVEHVDWSVGVLVDELRRQGLEENTLIVFTSDNGSRAMPPSGGSNAPLRGRKGQTWEGGQRVPCIMRWKGTIPEGRECASLVAAADFLPTFVNLAGGDIPESPTIDGVDLGCLLEGNTSATPRELFFYCRGNG
ncbi:sulfatase, partial [Candidatus Bathyarchaeota archaeon]|nr:sulfatase [Candidatus Bathyarchaeota archaeon]